MSHLEKPIKDGKIIYRSPSVPDLLRLLPMSLNELGSVDFKNDMNELIASMLEKIHILIVKIEHPKISTVEEALQSMDMTAPLIEICTECINLMGKSKEDDETKKP